MLQQINVLYQNKRKQFLIVQVRPDVLWFLIQFEFECGNEKRPVVVAIKFEYSF